MVAASEEERNLPKISSSIDEDDDPKEDLACGKDSSLAEQDLNPKSYFKTGIVWRNVIAFVLLHSYIIYGFVAYWHLMSWRVGLAALFGAQITGFGVTVGAHRLWAHRAYKAKLPLRIFLMLLQTSAGQNSIYIWCRDHRMHHKYVETDADPHTTTRGMFFAHMGWLMLRKHPELRRKGRNLDCSDLWEDPVVRFQYYAFYPMAVVLVGLVPFYVYHHFLGYPLEFAYFVALLRYVGLLHGTWCVNSLAHWLGDRPYDRNINPTENLFTSFLTVGEGFHNYHHVFPFDYKAAELNFSPLNLSTLLIKGMIAIGQIYDVKEATPEMVLKRKMRTGDGHVY